MERRYDIDWVRVIAIGLLIIYHIAVAFQPWGVFIGFIQSDKPLVSLWIPMSMLNIWRIPLLFFVSGMGVWFAMKKRDWLQLIWERTRRILIPFVFGVFAIVPLHLLLWMKYYNQNLTYYPDQSHLWFLANIFIYVVILSPLFYYLKKHQNGKAQQWFKKLFKTPAGLILITSLFVLEAIIVHPESFETYARTLHGYLLGFLAFFFGFYCSYIGETFWVTIRKWKWILLALAFSLFLIRMLLFNQRSPDIMMSVESCSWIFAVFGIASSYLNRPGRVLNYLRQGAYPVYILHMLFLYLGSYLIIPLDLPVWLKFFMIVIFTAAGCLGLYEMIRRVSFLRPLFGLNLKIPHNKTEQVPTLNK